MMLQINFKSGKPVYLQVVDQIKAAAASGTVQTGEPLPSIRPLAEELRVNRNTIAKAYGELESKGGRERIQGKWGVLEEDKSLRGLAVGRVRVSGLAPGKDEVGGKRRPAYVSDYVAFEPWMRVRETLDYLASFRGHWNRETERDLLGRFRLDEGQRTGALSKGQRTQVALIAAVCPEPELLLLDEPTSGLDPIVRREFIETVIGAYQEGEPGKRTILVSTHLIAEFEGLIDEFTIMDRGRQVLSLGADQARERYQKIRARFPQQAPAMEFKDALQVRREGRELELIANGGGPQIMEQLKGLAPESLTTESLTLEEIFVATLKS